MYKKFCFIYLLCLLIFTGSGFGQKSGYIVVYKSHAQKEKAVGRWKGKLKRSYSIIPATAGNFDANEVEELRNDPDILYIEPDYKVFALGTVGARGASGEVIALSSQTIPYGVTLVNAPSVWTKTKGAGVRVAVLDTGISMYHPDRGNVVAAESFVSGQAVEDFDGHGTHTAGILAGADNDVGIVGVAPQAELLIGKVLGNDGSGDISDIISGIEWAVNNNAKIISMSLGSTSYSASFNTACSNALAAGVLLVAAAGNDGTNTPSYPAAFSSVVSVSAVDSSKARASFSNYGSTIAVAAPGVNVYSTVALDSNAVKNSVTGDATADAVWNATSHQAYTMQGTAAGTVSGQICDCGLATGNTTSDSCPNSVAGNIALIHRGTITFADKIAYAKSKGAAGAIIWNNAAGNFFGTLSDGTALVVVTVSQADGTALQALSRSGITGSVSVNGTLYAYYDGTSMACPHAAGVAALIFAASGTNTSPATVRTILQNSAQDLGTSGKDQYYGYGLVNAAAAMNLVTPHNCGAIWVMGQGMTGDINRDCAVGWKDMKLIGTEWLNSCNSANNWCGQSDIGQSGSVNEIDLATVAAQWLSCNDPEKINCN